MPPKKNENTIDGAENNGSIDRKTVISGLTLAMVGLIAVGGFWVGVTLTKIQADIASLKADIYVTSTSRITIGDQRNWVREMQIENSSVDYVRDMIWILPYHDATTNLPPRTQNQIP